MGKEQKQTITERVLAVPLTESSDILIDKNAANAAFLLLEEAGSALPEHVKSQVESILSNALRELEEAPINSHYVIRGEALRSLLIDTAQRAVAQTVSDIGRVALEARALDDLMIDVPPQPEAP